MFCKSCGQPVEEGHLFCKNCGARVSPEDSVTEVKPPSDAEVTAVKPPSAPAPVPPPSGPPAAPSPSASSSPPTPPPPPPSVALGPPPPPSAAAAPPPAPVALGIGPGWQPPMPPAGQKSRTGLIIGIVAAAVIVLAGAGLGVYFGLLRDGDDGGAGAGGETTRTTVTTVADASTTSTTAATTSSSEVETTATTAGGATAQTVPGLSGSTDGTGTPTSRSTTTTAEDPYMRYLDSAFEVVNDLEASDRRIPDLATEINNTLPDVPDWVYEELQGMIDTILEDNKPMLYLDIPPEFRQANNHLVAAVTSMINRISFTMSGIEALWDTGNKTAGNSYFESGREERDRYRTEIEKFHDLLPVS